MTGRSCGRGHLFSTSRDQAFITTSGRLFCVVFTFFSTTEKPDRALADVSCALDTWLWLLHEAGTRACHGSASCFLNLCMSYIYDHI